MTHTVATTTTASAPTGRGRAFGGLRRLRRLLLVFVAGIATMVAVPGVALAYTDDPGKVSTSSVASHVAPAVPATGTATSAATSLTWMVPALVAILVVVAVVGVTLVLRRTTRAGAGAARTSSARI